MKEVKNFLYEYLAWADDKHAPSEYHLWACISAISACLERKVWLSIGQGKFTYYPNTYIFLVGGPAAGKSSAIDRVKGVLRDLNTDGGRIVFIPNSLSVSALIKCMAGSRQSHREGTRLVFDQSAAYFAAGEGSESLSAIHVGGELTNALTSLYDCLDLWERETRAHDNERIEKGCFSLLMGTTFSFLGEGLLTGSAIMGGFASRVTYILNDDTGHIRPPMKLPRNFTGAMKSHQRAPQHIIDGFARIHAMQGEFICEDEFVDAYEAWSPFSQAQLQSVESEKLQALLKRKDALIMKLSMILSAAESSDRIIKLRHWKMALSLADMAEDRLPKLLRCVQSDSSTHGGLVQAILACFDGNPRKAIDQEMMRQRLVLRNFDPQKINAMIISLASSKTLALEGRSIRLLVDPNAHL